MATWDITSDTELQTAVRHETGYEQSDLSDDRLASLIDRAKQRLYLRTDSSDWFSDSGLSLALFGYACIRAKSSIENIPLDSYNLLDEDVSFDTDSAEDSIQLQQWHQDVQEGLSNSVAAEQTTRLPNNSADYIGESYIADNDPYDRRY